MGYRKYLFSDRLLEMGQQYFEKLCKRKVSFEETERWLDSLAELYLAFAEIPLKRKKEMKFVDHI